MPRDGFERADEIVPFGIAVGVFLQVEAQAVAEHVVAQDIDELAEHAGGFGIDDGAVGGLGVLQIADLLINRSGALRGVDGVGGGFGGLVETLPHVFAGLEGIERVEGHVLREAFLEP